MGLRIKGGPDWRDVTLVDSSGRDLTEELRVHCATIFIEAGKQTRAHLVVNVDEVDVEAKRFDIGKRTTAVSENGQSAQDAAQNGETAQ